jgi:uncharacterized protein YcfJ
MKHVLATSAIALTLTTTAFADTSRATVEDHYKTVLEQKPYRVEVCSNVQVPYGQRSEMDTEGAIIGGIVGGLLGNQIGKGNGNKAATGAGAIAGAIIGGKKEGGPQGYRTERQCEVQTRYEESERTVYSHSTVSFYHDGRRVELKFQK